MVPLFTWLGLQVLRLSRIPPGEYYVYYIYIYIYIQYVYIYSMYIDMNNIYRGHPTSKKHGNWTIPACSTTSSVG